ncbi:hypothetical protein [Fusibacter ferrireducens]|uniref:Uncharacterized protein n=1 Tax=Fusibacter ferrireducens TaxID=2785058 RepID=A0ABR9ZSX7_9FIRM|nr:hypothetical protein [Fusibacter ferrireducens]MBF4692985.1 hypothetical protein [Fusibacter ferrireducens]
MKKIIVILLILGLILTSCGTESVSPPEKELDNKANLEQVNENEVSKKEPTDEQNTSAADLNAEVDQTTPDSTTPDPTNQVLGSVDRTNIPEALGGHKVRSYEKTDTSFNIVMDGIYEAVEGVLIKDELNDGYGFSMADRYYDTLESFEISFPDNGNFETFKVTPPGGLIEMDKAQIISVMGHDAIAKLDNGEQIQVTCNIRNYTNSIYYKSEGFSTADIEIIVFNKSLLADLILKYFEDISLSKQEIIDQLRYDYYDFTSDGIADVICYSPSGNGFNNTAFFTVKEGEITLVPCDYGWAKYEQAYHLNGPFIIKDATGGGTGLYTQTRELLVYNGEKVISTGVILVQNARTSAPDYETETVGTTQFDASEDYTRFIHEVETTGTEHSYKKTKYVYDPSTYTFEITELENTNSNQNEVVNNDLNNGSTSSYDIKTLKEGQKIEQFTIKNINYIENESTSFELEGEVTLEGVIEYDEMWYEFVFTSHENMLNRPIQIDDYSFYKPEYVAFDQELLSKEAMAYVKENKDIKVNVTFSKYSMATKDGTEGGSRIEIKDIQVLTDLNQKSGGTQDNNNATGQILQGLENEVFLTDNGDFFVDYSKYRCVVVPMKASKNLDVISGHLIPVQFSDEEPRLSFSVFGELEDVKINYVANMGEEGLWQEVGRIKDALVLIAASLPNDMSFVKVYGRVHKGDGTYENVEFTLDDVRDDISYKVYTVE